jgi:aldehyde:ferredoxin oxidoreductase
MRKYLDIDLQTRSISARELNGVDIAKGGRWFIANELLAAQKAGVDPLSADNPLIFRCGPWAGSSFSNANRISVGCKSPLTGGIKEANGGGTFGYGLGQLLLAGFTLNNISDDWVVMHFKQDGSIAWDSAADLLGKGNFEVAQALYARYGKKVAIGLCGPVGEYQGNLAGIAFSDIDLRPSRLAARGGVGAVMGSKRVKAIVLDLSKTPAFHDPKGVRDAVKDYAKMLLADSIVTGFYGAVGTMAMADFQNHLGGLPVRNFTGGTFADTAAGETFKMGGDYIGPLNKSRGGNQTHACMPGCTIQCSNVYHDADGKELVSPVEYETLGLLGTNCGLGEPDDLAQMNYLCNDMGIDTIETGAMIGVLMDAGKGAFGDKTFMGQVLAEVRMGTELGKHYAQGTAAVGERLGHKRIPVIKRQAISAYDPRVVEATGLSMMATAQGADHTVGNLPRLKTKEMTLAQLSELSLQDQIKTAAQDSLGLCIFGRSVTNAQLQFMMNAVNAATGSDVGDEFFYTLGREALKLEHAFNRAAGFSTADDDLPQFFYDEPLAPTGFVARFKGSDVATMYEGL